MSMFVMLCYQAAAACPHGGSAVVLDVDDDDTAAAATMIRAVHAGCAGWHLFLMGLEGGHRRRWGVWTMWGWGLMQLCCLGGQSGWIFWWRVNNLCGEVYNDNI